MGNHTQETLSLLENGYNANNHLRLAQKRDDSSLKVHFADYQTLDGKKVNQVSCVGDGSIITRFDKTPVPKELTDVVCPHFLELKWGTGCQFNCAWCYLQGTFRFLEYKKEPRPKDFDRVAKALTALFEESEGAPELLNAGELADSLMAEKKAVPFTRFVMNAVSTQDRYKILFLTKSTEVANLLKVKNKDQCVVGFSVNSVKVSNTWERAPRVVARLDAAKKLFDAGFTVRFRIDPMVPIEGWKKEYSNLIDMIFKRVVPERITLGSLRGLQSTINNAQDKSWVMYLDEKSNWGRKIALDTRSEMYRFVIERLSDKYDYHNVALCKETVQMWDSLGLDYRHIKCNCTP